MVRGSGPQTKVNGLKRGVYWVLMGVNKGDLLYEHLNLSKCLF